LGKADIWGIEDRKGTHVLSGAVEGGVEGGESSWCVDGMVDVRVSVLLSSPCWFEY
jgi:hypothetical protein